MKRAEAIAWLEIMKEDAIFEQHDALKMAIKALQGDMYCPNCGVRLVPEDEYLEPKQTHGRLIDADALYEYITNKVGGVDCAVLLDNEIAPTVQADRPHGEWIVKLGIPYCNNCEKGAIHESDFCPNCGADMRKEAEVGHKPDYSYEDGMARRLIEETLKNKLQELAQCDDYEIAHMKADELLCDFITKLGYGEVAQKFDAVPKWYA